MKRLPKSWIVAVVGICLLPTLLNLAGVSFASPTIPLDRAAVVSLSAAELTDALHRTLSGSFTHTILEWAAFFAAFFIFILSVAHYRLAQEVTIPIIGIALLCAGVMDAFHVLAADRLIYAVADNQEFIPFTWAISRLFNAIILIVGTVLVMAREPSASHATHANQRFVVGTGVFFVLVAYVVILICARSPSLPTTIFPGAAVTRPFDVAPLALFVLAGIFVFPRFYRKHPNLFSHALLVSVAPQIVTQLHMAFGSTALYDNHFNIAHGLKVVAYGIPLAGLVSDYVRTYREVETMNVQLTSEVSERVAAEEALRRAHEELESRVVERTRDLNRAKSHLEEAKVAAETASRAKSDFLANMSHELRTPLNGILGYAQILERDGNLTRKQRDNAQVIRSSGEHLLSLINEVLDLAKIESGRLELATGEFGLRKLLEHVAGMARVRAQEKGLHFRYQELTALPAGVIGDERKLRQVLFNLLGNAVKFTDEGMVTLEVGYRGNRLRFRVTDTGVGIASSEVEEMFQPFGQSQATDRRPEGTGLGLGISRSLVELMGGELALESDLGEGSTFSFDLELPEAAGWKPSASDGSRPIVGIAGIEGDAPRILVVDDRNDNRAFLRDLLAPVGFVLEEAKNGQEAIEKARSFRPALIFMDLVMPVLDGFEAVRRIRRDDELAGVVIIALSASAFDHSQKDSRDAGCDDFLPKPLASDALFQMMQQHLGLRWTYDGADAPGEGAASKERLGSSKSLAGAQAGRLYELARVGDIGAIETELDTMAEADPELDATIAELRKLAKKFDMKKMRAFLESLLEATP